MKIKTSFRYQFADYKKGIIIYYLIMTVIMIASVVGAVSISNMREGNYEMGTINGFSAATAIFALVCGLNAFKENFGFHLQNGASRRTLFAGRLVNTVATALIMAVLDFVLQLLTLGANQLIGNVFKSSTILDMILAFTPQVQMGFWESQLMAVLFSFVLFLGLSGLGYFLTIVFYRMNKLGKILVGAGIPVLLWIILPLVDLWFAGMSITSAIFQGILYLMGILTGNLLLPLLTFTGMFVVTSGLAWLFIRKITVK